MPIELMPIIDRVSRAALRRLGAESRMVELNGHRVHLMDMPGTGSGPPLVLLHGLGSNGLTFARIMPALARTASRVLSADLPGCGFSPAPPQPIALEESVQFLADLYTRELHGTPAVFLGNSLGGAMALVLGAERPDLVRALVLVAPAGAKVPRERFDYLVRSFDMRTWRDGRNFVRRLYHRAPRLVPSLLGREMVALFAGPGVREFLVGDRSTDYVQEERLARLHMPVLLLWARSEKLLPYEGLDYFRANLPKHAIIEEVDGFGHAPHLEATDDLIGRVTRFITDLPEAKPVVAKTGTAG